MADNRVIKTLSEEDPSPAASPVDEEISLLGIGSILLNWRRPILGLALGGAVIGLVFGLASPREYTSGATFVPQGAEVGNQGLAAAASQFGLRLLPSGGSGWGPPMYVEVLRSRALLEPIAMDTVRVAEKGGRRVALMDLLGIQVPNPARRMEVAIRVLNGIVQSNEVKAIGGVRVSATTRWPSVSLALAEELVNGVNQFNLETRKSQAAAERQFVEQQAGAAELALRNAEDRLQSFLQRNRETGGSPQLVFERDRLQRDVNLRQQLYSTLLQSREEAKIREVRDTPVITVIEPPRLPVVGESRKTIQKSMLGAVAGAVIGVFTALFASGLSRARRTPSEEARQFFRLLEEATPRFMRRAGR